MSSRAKPVPGFGTSLGIILAIASAVFGVVAVMIEALKWNLVDLLTPFLMTPLELLAWAVVAVLTLVSLIYLLLAVRRVGMWAALPLRINVLIIAILVLVPFTDIWLRTNFASKLAGREAVVEMVERTELAASRGSSVTLPNQYRQLSKAGRILVEAEGGVTRVFFFTFVGVLDNFSGFMYTSDDRPPGSMSFLGDWQQIERWRPHWYFCASS